MLLLVSLSFKGRSLFPSAVSQSLFHCWKSQLLPEGSGGLGLRANKLDHTVQGQMNQIEGQSSTICEKGCQIPSVMAVAMKVSGGGILPPGLQGLHRGSVGIG